MASLTRFLVAGIALLSASAMLEAQGVRGVVRAADGRPLSGAELSAGESAVTTRTDSAGVYTIPRVPPGTTILRVRFIGHTPIDSGIVVLTESWTEINVVMSPVAPLLTEVRAFGMQNDCDPYTLDGFECRVQAGVGYYRNAEELEAMNPRHFAALFDGFPGIRLRPAMTSRGVTLVPGVRPSRCLVTLIDGRPPFTPLTFWNPEDVIGVEYYDTYSKVPVPFRPYVKGFCDLIVYWLDGARRKTPSPAPTVAKTPTTLAGISSNAFFEVIVRMLHNSQASEAMRFVPEGHRIAIDFTGLDTALNTLGLVRSPSLAALQTRFPEMRFESARTTMQCADSVPQSQCVPPANVASVRFFDPQPVRDSSYTLSMSISTRVVEPGEVITERTGYELVIERRGASWLLLSAFEVYVPER